MFRRLLSEIDGYLTTRRTSQDLEGWLLSNLQAVLDSVDEAAIELANRVDADFIELGEALIDEATLRERLETYIRNAETVSFSFPEEVAVTHSFHATASVETIRGALEVLPVVDLRLAHVFA